MSRDSSISRILLIVILLIISTVNAYSVVVLTDLHIDFQYDCKENASAWCRSTIEPTVERYEMAFNPNRRLAKAYIEENHGTGKSRISSASNGRCAPFTRYGCDASISMALETFRKLAREDRVKPFDAVIMLGDYVAHWPLNETVLLNTIKYVVQAAKDYLPNKKIIMTLGNDDFFPGYTMSTDNNWDFYRQMYQVAGFNHFLNDPEEVATFMKGGYYKTTLPGTKYTVLSLNTLIYSYKRKDPKNQEKISNSDPIDPLGQFEWLDRKLSEVSVPNSVWIAAHIPPTEEDTSKLMQWKIQYQQAFLAILAKHQDKIMWLGFGHFHREDWRLFDNNKFFGIVHPSISPLFVNNGGFRRYDVNGTRISDYEQYYFDIYQSNLLAKPVWFSYTWKGFQPFNPMRNDLDINSVRYFNDLLNTDSRVLLEYNNVRYGQYLQDRTKYTCEITKYTQDDYLDCIARISNDGVPNKDF